MGDKRVKSRQSTIVANAHLPVSCFELHVSRALILLLLVFFLKLELLLRLFIVACVSRLNSLRIFAFPSLVWSLTCSLTDAAKLWTCPTTQSVDWLMTYFVTDWMPWPFGMLCVAYTDVVGDVIKGRNTRTFCLGEEGVMSFTYIEWKKS